MADPRNVEGMARFGINPKETLGVSVYVLRDMAKKIEKDHALAQKLWKSKIHEARMLAGFVDDPGKVTAKQMESWVKDFDSWDICDQVCSNLFDKTPYAYAKAREWSRRKDEFVRRAGYVLMAALSVHDKKADDKRFEQFYPLIKKGSADERNYVRKAVNWALRQIGKRSKDLNISAVRVGKEIQKIDSKVARWIASDALRELQSPKIKNRFRK
jgi:3-methyladenine DNA glycosylase AlkD